MAAGTPTYTFTISAARQNAQVVSLPPDGHLAWPHPPPPHPHPPRAANPENQVVAVEVTDIARTDRVYSVVLDAGGETMCTGGRDKKVAVYDLPTADGSEPDASLR